MDSSSDTEPGYDSEEEEKRWRLNNLRDALRDGKKKFNNQLKQVEEAVNTLINKNNAESDKAFSWFMN